MARTRIIVNADDFGQSKGINSGILECYENGIVTSASVMVRYPDAIEAAYCARNFPKFSLGLHVDLGEWRMVGGCWVPVYEVVSLVDHDAVHIEVNRQLQEFRRLMGRYPSHLDSHQHVHIKEPVRTVMIRLARQLAIPLRHFTREIEYCGAFYGQSTEGHSMPENVSSTRLVELLRAARGGVSEISCHPGRADDANTMYRGERAIEIEALCNPRTFAAIAEQDVDLISFSDVKRVSISQQ